MRRLFWGIHCFLKTGSTHSLREPMLTTRPIAYPVLPPVRGSDDAFQRMPNKRQGDTTNMIHPRRSVISAPTFECTPERPGEGPQLAALSRTTTGSARPVIGSPSRL